MVVVGLCQLATVRSPLLPEKQFLISSSSLGKSRLVIFIRQVKDNQSPKQPLLQHHFLSYYINPISPPFFSRLDVSHYEKTKLRYNYSLQILKEIPSIVPLLTYSSFLFIFFQLLSCSYPVFEIFLWGRIVEYSNV